jgi:alpha-mannosidase
MVSQDRYVPRIDQGERQFRFWVNGGHRARRLQSIDREALVKNEKPFILVYFPAGRGKKPSPFIVLSDDVVQVSAVKKAEDGNDMIIRLFEPTGVRRTTLLSLPWAPAKKRITLAPFEIRTFRFNPQTRRFSEADLLERPLRKRR